MLQVRSPQPKNILDLEHQLGTSTWNIIPKQEGPGVQIWGGVRHVWERGGSSEIKFNGVSSTKRIEQFGGGFLSVSLRLAQGVCFFCSPQGTTIFFFLRGRFGSLGNHKRGTGNHGVPKPFEKSDAGKENNLKRSLGVIPCNPPDGRSPRFCEARLAGLRYSEGNQQCQVLGHNRTFVCAAHWVLQTQAALLPSVPSPRMRTRLCT